MSERKADDRLQELRDKGITIYSISRLDCINRCLYEAYQTYILGKRGPGNIWTSLGGRIHDVLEGITNGTNTEKDLLPAMYAELDDMDMLGIEFPKARDGKDTIRDNWIANMKNFCTEYKPPKGNLKAEELFIYQTPKGRYLQGYIDLQSINKDGSISIYDYKTSSLYRGEDIKEHGRQLIVYAMGKEQEGFTVKSASWIFLKYVTVKFFGKKTVKSKKDSEIIKVIERRNFGRELALYLEGTLAKAGYDEFDIEMMIDQVVATNSIENLPDEVKNQYKITPYVLSVDLSEEARQECIDYIDGTIDKWEALHDESQYLPRKFTKVTKTGKETSETFFCSVLCPHSKSCFYLRDYLDTLEDNKNTEEDDLF